MVCQWGLSEKVGLVVFNRGETHPFLGKELAEQRDFSEATAREIDEEVRNILHNCHEEAVGLLEENRGQLELLAETLMEEETLSATEIEDILSLGRSDAEEAENQASQA